MDLERNRKNLRVKCHNYSEGYYFVTVVTDRRIHYFGEIRDNEMQLTQIGEFLQSQMEGVMAHYPYARVISYVIMPNHLHAIIKIDPLKIPSDKRLTNQFLTDKIPLQQVHATQGWLSVVVGGIKSYVSKSAHRVSPQFAWERQFFDHIIRDNGDYFNHIDYINQNVARWHEDEYNVNG